MWLSLDVSHHLHRCLASRHLSSLPFQWVSPPPPHLQPCSQHRLNHVVSLLRIDALTMAGKTLSKLTCLTCPSQLGSHCPLGPCPPAALASWPLPPCPATLLRGLALAGNCSLCWEFFPLDAHMASSLSSFSCLGKCLLLSCPPLPQTPRLKWNSPCNLIPFP